MRPDAALLLLGAVVIAACAQEKTRAEIEAEDARAGVTSGRDARGAGAPPGATTDSAAGSAPGERGPLPEGPSSLRRIALLDDSARLLPTDPRAAGWLYAAGVEGSQFAFFDPTTGTDSAYLAALPEAYYSNEIAGSHTYTGWHLTELGRRFPADTLADDAGFLLAQHHDFVAGECEGFFFCYLAASVGPWARFLRAHPASPLVPLALAAADSALRANFDMLEAGQVEFAAMDTTVRDPAQQGHQVESVDATLAELEQAVSSLPATERERAMRILAPITARWQRAKGAR